MFNLGHNVAILLTSLLTLLFYVEVTERGRPCGLGRPLNNHILGEILKVFAITAAVTILVSFVRPALQAKPNFT